MITLRGKCVVVSGVTCNRNVNRQCRYDDVPVANPFSSARTTGQWYVVRVYPESGLEPSQVFDDLSYTVDGPSGRIEINYRKKSGECKDTNTVTVRELTSGVFEYNTGPNTTVSYKSSYASSNRQYGIVFFCYEFRGDICTDPEVHFISRGKPVLTSGEMSELEALVKDLCVDPSVFANPDHNKGCPAQVEEKPDDKAVTRRVNPQCRYNDVPVANPFSSARTTGQWYVVRVYPERGLEPSQVFDDFSYTVDGPSGRIKINYRRKSGQCSDTISVTVRELTSGVFEYDAGPNKTVSYKASYASSNRQYGIVFFCYEFRGDICTDPEVHFISRGKPVLTSGEISELEALVKDLCVDPSVFANPVHNKGCPSQGMKLVPENEELVRAQKEMLEASRDKFREETEVMRLRKEKLQLEIQILRRRYNLK